MDAARRYYEEGIQVLETREGGVTSHGLLCLSSFAVFLDETIGQKLYNILYIIYRLG